MAPKLLKTLITRHGTMLALPQDVYITPCLQIYGEFSRGEMELLAQIAKPGMTVVEVGANIGVHTVPLARACHPGPLYAFEPQRRVFQVLCANLALNDIENVVASPQACGEAPGVVTIPALDYAARGNFGGVSVRPAGETGEAGERVAVVRLDDLRLASCGLIKVDVEGYEPQVLVGASETIARCRPVLYVENDRVENQRRLIGLIADMGYRLYWHTPPLATGDNFNGVRQRIFDQDFRSLNMLCLPNELQTQTDLEAIDPADPRMAAGMPGGGEPLAGG